MRLAILYDNDKVCVEFSPDDFKRLLYRYFDESKDIKTAYEKVVAELKRKVLYK